MHRIQFDVPGLRIQSVQNLREHYFAAAKRVKHERKVVGLSALCAGLRPADQRRYQGAEVKVWLTRIAPRPIHDEHDNLRAGFKATCDQVAEVLGLNDRRIVWVYAQEAGRYGVRIAIEAVSLDVSSRVGLSAGQRL